MPVTITTAGAIEAGACAACDAAMAAQCNANAADALQAGLLIGVIVGALFLYLGMTYRGSKK